VVIKDDMFRPSCGHHQVYIKNTETYEELRTYMGSICFCIFNVDLMMTA